MIKVILNIIHLLIVLFPIIIYFIPNKCYPYFKYIFLVLLLIPLHWVFFDNQCVFSIITQKAGDFEDVKTKNPFTEKYLKWLYEPIMSLLNLKWNNKNIEKMVYIHWIILFILIWYYIYFYNFGKCI